MNKFEIEIPEGKEIDWQESAKQEQIVFKQKQLTYADVCQKLFKDGYCYIDAYGHAQADGVNVMYIDKPNNGKTRHQLECILAKNKLANVARYLNGDWKPDLMHDDFWILVYVPQTDHIITVQVRHWTEMSSVLFNSASSAKQAIQILGKENIKLALEPLY